MTQSNKLPEVKSDDPFVTRILKRNEFPPDSYFEEEHCKINSSAHLYDLAHKLEIKGAYDIEELTDEQKLVRIRQEILVRTKITSLEIFKIGKLLTLAKPICRRLKIRFKEWVTNNHDFSYETGVNFMQVYRSCLGMESIAVNLDKTVLYKISEPSFPDDLREYLYATGSITKLTCMDLTQLVAQYDEGGFDAIKDSIEKWNYEFDMYEQTQFVLDRCIGLKSMIEQTRFKIMNKFGYYKEDRFIETERKLLPAADKINKELLNTIYSCEQVLETAIQKARSSVTYMLAEIEDALAE